MSTSRCKTYIYLSIDRFIGFNEMISIHIVSVCPHCPHQKSILFVAMYTPYNTLDHITCHSRHQCPQQPIVHIHCLNRTYSTYCYITSFLFSSFHAPSFPFCCSLHAHHFPMFSVPDICCVHFGFVACSYCLTLILSIFVCLPCTHGPRKFFCCFSYDTTSLLRGCHRRGSVAGHTFKSFFPGTSIHSLSSLPLPGFFTQ